MALEGPTPPLLTRGSIKEAAERSDKQYKGTTRMYRTPIRKVQEVLIEGV